MYQDNFIFQQYLNDLSICDELIDYFEKSDQKEIGYSGLLNGENVVDKKIKDSTDVCLNYPYNEIILKYATENQKILDSYIKKFTFSNSYSAFKIVEGVNIQHYAPKQGFHAWHCERTSAWPDISANRHLVFMTYLNDVTDKGETEFFHQKLKVQPRKGLTLIWPVDWTYTHRGIPSPTQHKYIITGWFSFINNI